MTVRANAGVPPVRGLKRFQEGPGPVRGKTITEFQALRYLRAVMIKFRSWDDPDRSWFSDNPPLFGDMPYIRWDYTRSGHPAIPWEGNSPYEWAYGGIENDFRDPEFGFLVKGVPVPRGVFAEPEMSFILALYPDK